MESFYQSLNKKQGDNYYWWPRYIFRTHTGAWMPIGWLPISPTALTNWLLLPCRRTIVQSWTDDVIELVIIHKTHNFILLATKRKKSSIISFSSPKDFGNWLKGQTRTEMKRQMRLLYNVQWRGQMVIQDLDSQLHLQMMSQCELSRKGRTRLRSRQPGSDSTK